MYVFNSFMVTKKNVISRFLAKTYFFREYEYVYGMVKAIVAHLIFILIGNRR